MALPSAGAKGRHAPVQDALCPWCGDSDPGAKGQGRLLGFQSWEVTLSEMNCQPLHSSHSLPQRLR